MMLEIGPYKHDATEDEAYYHADQHDMAATYSSSRTRGDSIGVGKHLYFIYDDPRYVFSAEKMWYFNSHGKYIGQRHPLVSPENHPMSRDHYTNTLLLLKIHYDRTGSTASMAKIKEITDNIGYIISEMARRTFGLKWWSKAIQGSKWHEFIFYIFEIITVLFVYIPLHKLGSWIAEYGEEVDQEDYVPYPDGPRLQEQPLYKQKIDKWIYPSFALQLSGWKLYVLRDSIGKKILGWLFRRIVGKTNYVQQMFFGKKGIPRDKIESFQPMQGGRWGGYLSMRNDRNMRIRNPRPQFNNRDCDLARKLYNETQQ
jgi:hypothetical protein